MHKCNVLSVPMNKTYLLLKDINFCPGDLGRLLGFSGHVQRFAEYHGWIVVVSYKGRKAIDRLAHECDGK